MTVYDFTTYDPTVGEKVRAPRPATLETILACEGTLLEDTAQQVEVSELDGNGFYHASGTIGAECRVEGKDKDARRKA